MERRVVCTVIISPGVPLSADPAAVKDRGLCTVVPPQVHDWASLQQYLRSAYTIPDGSFYDILDAFEDGYAWFKLDGIDSLPDSTSWFVKVTLPSSDSVALTSVLDKIEKIAADVSATRAEVSSTRSASRINAEDFGFLTRALKIVGPVSEDINGNVIDSEDVLDSLLGDERFWDERYEEQQRDRYAKEVEGWLSTIKGDRKVRWVNGNRETVRCRIEGLHFTCTSKNDDLVAVVRSFGCLFSQGAVLGVELKRKNLTRRLLRQALTEFLLWADASHFPFIQLVTNMESGGLAYYCKRIDAVSGIHLRQVVLKNMEEVKNFVAKVGASLPDDLGDDKDGNLVMPQTLDEPKREKFRQLEQPGPYPSTGGSSSSGVQYERPTKAQLLLWTLGPRILENEDDVANMADLEAFNLPAEMF